jgi:elongation factor P--beta-lysine ligase
MKLNHLYIKEEIVKAIRLFFKNEIFHEVITPVFNTSLPLEPNIFPFVTTWKRNCQQQKFYLSTSPEAYLKKMLALGIGNCFAISKSFRNLEGCGPDHNPEFLMLEWYREYADYFQIMDDTRKFILFIKKRIDEFNDNKPSPEIRYQNKLVNLHGKWPVLSLITLFNEYARLDLKGMINDEALYRAAIDKGYNIKNATWEQIFNQIFLNEIEPKLPTRPLFITDFPSRISPLAAPQKNKPEFAERFEFYIFGKELGNGNTENTDSQAVLNIFKTEENERIKSGHSYAPIDYGFINSLEKMKGKKCAGMGLGIDRLVMIFANSTSIQPPGIETM